MSYFKMKNIEIPTQKYNYTTYYFLPAKITSRFPGSIYWVSCTMA